MRFEGTDTALMVVANNEKDGDGEDFEAAFKRDYKTEFGFLLDTKSIIVDDIKVYRKPFFFSLSKHINIGPGDWQNIRLAWSIRLC